MQTGILCLAMNHKRLQPKATIHDCWKNCSFIDLKWGEKRKVFNLDEANINGRYAFYGSMLKELLDLQPCVKEVIDYNDTTEL